MPLLKFDNFMIKKKQNVNIEISNYYEQKENIHVNIQHENTPKKIKTLKFTKNQTNCRSGFLPKLFFKNNFWMSYFILFMTYYIYFNCLYLHIAYHKILICTLLCVPHVFIFRVEICIFYILFGEYLVPYILFLSEWHNNKVFIWIIILKMHINLYYSILQLYLIAEI